MTLSEDDNRNPDYLRLREQLSGIQQHMDEEYGIRVIYAMKVVDGQIKFIVDSSAFEDSIHSEPGVVYEQPPQILLDTITDKSSRVGGPYTDEYGRFYSAFAPHRDATGQVVAYMGTDIDASHYDKLVADGLRPARLMASVLLMLYVMAFFLIQAILGAQRRRRAVELERLHRAEERENLLMNLSEGIVAFDKTGRVVLANRAAVNAVCQNDADCQGQDYRVFWKRVDQRGHPVPIRHKTDVATGGPVKAERTYLRRWNGEIFPVELQTMKIHLDAETPATVITFRDLTSEAKAEQIKTDFVSMAVHQLKTPLTALKWAVELLSEKTAEKSPQEQQAIEDIVGVTQRLNDLVTSLLNITRIETGRLTVEPRPTALNDLAVDVVHEMRPLAEAKKQEIHLDLPSRLPAINIDARLIREVFRNLLSNAIKYTTTGGLIKVRIEMTETEMITSVKDNGVGIPATEMSRLFDKFYRGSNILNLPEEGTGLGLSLVKQIIEVSGGRIWFESTEGVGSRFFFALPLKGSEAKAGTVRLS